MVLVESSLSGWAKILNFAKNYRYSYCMKIFMNFSIVSEINLHLYLGTVQWLLLVGEGLSWRKYGIQ